MLEDFKQKEKYTLKELRLLSKLTQEEIAEAIGVSHYKYRQMEKDSKELRKTKMEVFLKLFDLLEIDSTKLDFYFEKE